MAISAPWEEYYTPEVFLSYSCALLLLMGDVSQCLCLVSMPSAVVAYALLAPWLSMERRGVSVL